MTPSEQMTVEYAKEEPLLAENGVPIPEWAWENGGTAIDFKGSLQAFQYKPMFYEKYNQWVTGTRQTPIGTVDLAGRDPKDTWVSCKEIRERQNRQETGRGK